MGISRSDARELAKSGTEMGAKVLRGTLTIGLTGISIDGISLEQWLTEFDGAEFILVGAPVGRSQSEGEVKTCLTCGRDYRGERCPHCAEARARLRG